MLVQQIENRIPNLSDAQRSVARVIVDQPAEVVRWSIHELAVRANVSEPTVMRFCRTLGCEGFQDFKLRLVQSLAMAQPYSYLKVDAEDTTADIATKVFDATISKLTTIRNGLDLERIEAAIEALRQAKRVEFYGLGISGRVATDAHHKFFRLGVPCIAYTDIEMQQMSARTLQPTDVVFMISNSGETQELLIAARLARRQGATVVAITGAGSSLAQIASIALLVEPLERKEVHSPLISRIAHLLVLDTLAVGLAVGRAMPGTGPESSGNGQYRS